MLKRGTPFDGTIQIQREIFDGRSTLQHCTGERRQGKHTIEILFELIVYLVSQCLTLGFASTCGKIRVKQTGRWTNTATGTASSGLVSTGERGQGKHTIEIAFEFIVHLLSQCTRDC